MLKTWALMGATLVAAWFTMTTTIGSVFARSRPALALSWVPYNAEANGNRSMELFVEQTPKSDWKKIGPFVRAALKRSPANVAAVSVLAAQADIAGRPSVAWTVFKQSDRISRHEPLTQLYLIEASVARGDIKGALRHYDAALSTSRANSDVLLPVLVAASADPTVARSLAALLSRRPVWWPEFIRRFIQTPADPAASFPIILNALKLDRKNSMERAMLSGAITRLIDTGHEALAYSQYRRVVAGAPVNPAFVRNGSFEQPVGLEPFDWQIRDVDEASGSIQPRGSGNALYVSASNADTEVAMQRLLLPVGSYVLSARFGSDDQAAGQMQLSVACGSGRSNPLAVLHPAVGNRLAQVTFAIPTKDCSNQRLSVVVASPGDQMGSQSWVDDIMIRNDH